MNKENLENLRVVHVLCTEIIKGASRQCTILKIKEESDWPGHTERLKL